MRRDEVQAIDRDLNYSEPASVTFQGAMAQAALNPDLIGALISGNIAYADAISDFERRVLRQVLQACDGNRSEAARRLHLHRPNLTRLLKRLDISGDKS